MKTPFYPALALLVLLSTLNSQLSIAFAQGTAFSYQGRLNLTGQPASGAFDLRFSLFATGSGGTEVAGPITNSAVAVNNGLFAVTLDFGNKVFNGTPFWLQIDVQTNGGAGFTALSPRQLVSPSPYAIFAGSANAAGLEGILPAANLNGTYGGIVNFTNGSNSFIGNGSALAGVNAVALNGLGASNFWQVIGNVQTSPANGNFLGTADNQPLELRVNNLRAARYEPGGVSSAAASSGYGFPTGAPNGIGGAPVNFAAAGVVGAFIGGGGATNYEGLAYTNSVLADFGAIAGGVGNTIQINAPLSAIGGGTANVIQAGASYSFIGCGYINVIAPGAYLSAIGGGEYNAIGTNATYSVIGGGDGNGIQTGAAVSVIAGGTANAIQAGASYSFIGCGYGNVIAPNAYSSAISGGDYNSIQASDNYSVIGGGQANSIQTEAGWSVIGGGDLNTNQSEASVIGGGAENQIQAGADWSVIGGGDLNTNQSGASVIGGGAENQIQAGATTSVIDGGELNSIAINADASVISGGYGNAIQTNAFTSVIGGGDANEIQTNAFASLIGSGELNTIQTDAHLSVIVGGNGNTVQTNASYSAIGGGVVNTSTGLYGTVPGGKQNMAAAYSFAAGYKAQATNAGSFVWSDGSGTVTASTSTNQFVVRASGGIFFYSSDTNLSPPGVYLASGSGSWSSASDRNVKENFEPVDARKILTQVAQLPLSTWNYNTQDKSIRHVGPMAQDFHVAFGVGENDTTISTVDEGGVALAAIQGLAEKVENSSQTSAVRIQKLEAENAELKQQNSALEQRLAALEQRVFNQGSN